MANSRAYMLINDGKHLNSQFLAAIMAYPHDPSRAELYTTASIQNALYHKDDVTKATMQIDFSKQVKDAVWPGMIAGKIFNAVLIGLSLGEARYLASQTMNGTELFGRRQGLHLDSAKNHWRKYKNVSHLWAAYLMMQGTGEEKDCNLLVQLSNELLKMADGKFPLSDWSPTIVETDKGPFHGEIYLPDLPEESRKVLENYPPKKL